MNIKALARNWLNAKAFCRGPSDRLKYLHWLYCGSLRLGNEKKKRHTIHFEFEKSLGKMVLTVRCNAGSDAFIFSEVFDHRYYDFDLAEPPATILDAGANAGFTALFFGRKYPKAQLACVEPMPDNVVTLRTNIEQNGIFATIIPMALSVNDGSITMETACNDYGHKIANIQFGRLLGGNTFEVMGVTIPTLLAQLRWRRISLLKLDIEGYEGVLLRQNCGWLQQVDAIAIETHEGFGEADLCLVASRYGFKRPRRLPGIWLITRPAP